MILKSSIFLILFFFSIVYGEDCFNQPANTIDSTFTNFVVGDTNDVDTAHLNTIVKEDKNQQEDSIFVELAPPKETTNTYKRITCPVCHNCYPKLSDVVWSTAAHCDCCNTITQTGMCNSTNKGFTITYGECEILVWGIYVKIEK